MHFLLYGADSYRSKKQLDKFIAEFKARRDPQGYNTVVVSGESSSLDEILGQCLISPFLGEKRLVVVKNISENKDESVLEGLYKKLKEGAMPEYVVLVFWEKKNFDKKAHKLFALLASEKYSQLFEPLQDARLAEWICAQADAGGVRFDTSAAILLVESIGSHMGALDIETQKLIAWARAENKKIITKNDVRVFIPAALDEDVFRFMDVLFQGNTPRALDLLYAQRNSGASEQEIFGALLWQIRTLLEIKDFMIRNTRASSADCARELGIHPFVIKKTGAFLLRVSMQFLSSLHEYLLGVDRDIKTGARTASFAFDQMVFDIAQMIQKTNT